MALANGWKAELHLARNFRKTRPSPKFADRSMIVFECPTCLDTLHLVPSFGRLSATEPECCSCRIQWHLVGPDHIYMAWREDDASDAHPSEQDLRSAKRYGVG